MAKNELLEIIKNILAKYRTMSYSELIKMTGNLQPEIYTHAEPKDQEFYQAEVEVVYDDKASGNLRVIGMIDDGKGQSAIYNLIISPEGLPLSEGGK